jgi:sirohydrochlorin ferrochelatase
LNKREALRNMAFGVLAVIVTLLFTSMAYHYITEVMARPR